MKEWLMEFAKTPVGTAICIGVGIIVLVVMVFAKTSFGKKAIRDLTAKVLQNKSVVEKAKTICEEARENCDTKVAELETETKEKVANLENEIQKLTELVIALAKPINNVNVKKVIENYENSKVDKIPTETEKVAETTEKE